jgi:hypothetical protein
MSAALATRAEIAKLARLLDVEPARLAYLEPVDAADIAALRDQATDVLFDDHRATLQRAVAASRLLPAQVSVKIGERAFGPLLCARIAGLLQPPAAVDVARRLPTEFLADVAVELDPRRAVDVIAQIPTPQVVAVARELVARREDVVLGRFVGFVSSAAIAAALDVIDDAALLRIAFVMEGKERLGEIVGLLSDERVTGLLRAAVAEDLSDEVLDLVDHVDDATCERIGARAAELGTLDLVDGLRAAVGR